MLIYLSQKSLSDSVLIYLLYRSYSKETPKKYNLMVIY